MIPCLVDRGYTLVFLSSTVAPNAILLMSLALYACGYVHAVWSHASAAYPECLPLFYGSLLTAFAFSGFLPTPASVVPLLLPVTQIPEWLRCQLFVCHAFSARIYPSLCLSKLELRFRLEDFQHCSVALRCLNTFLVSYCATTIVCTSFGTDCALCPCNLVLVHISRFSAASGSGSLDSCRAGFHGSTCFPAPVSSEQSTWPIARPTQCGPDAFDNSRKSAKERSLNVDLQPVVAP